MPKEPFDQFEKETGPVLRSLLGRADLNREQAETVIHRALAWLAQNQFEKEAGSVLRPLLGRADLKWMLLESFLSSV